MICVAHGNEIKHVSSNLLSYHSLAAFDNLFTETMGEEQYKQKL